MPQMMPLNWLLLMSFFSIIFIMSLSFMYFIKFFNLKKNSPQINPIKLNQLINWMW